MLTHTVTKKAYRVLGLISKSFERKDPDVIVRLYTTLVHPIIEYKNVLWGPIALTYQIIKNQKESNVKQPE